MVGGTAKANATTKANAKAFHEWVIQVKMLSRVFVFNFSGQDRDAYASPGIVCP
jgi:hypothetical protein